MPKTLAQIEAGLAVVSTALEQERALLEDMETGCIDTQPRHPTPSACK